VPEPLQRVSVRTPVREMATWQMRGPFARYKVITGARPFSPSEASTSSFSFPLRSDGGPASFLTHLKLGRRLRQLLDTLSSLCGAPAESALGEQGGFDDAALFCERAHLVHGVRAFQPAAGSA
jgi:hypothetical protein